MNYIKPYKLYCLPAGLPYSCNGDHTGVAGFLTAKGML